MNQKSFVVGKVYKFVHQKKGTFYARVIAIRPGDELDSFFVDVEYDTRKGSDQAHMRTSGDKRVSGLRPSFILGLREESQETWDRIPKQKLIVERKTTIKDFIPKWVKGK